MNKHKPLKVKKFGFTSIAEDKILILGHFKLETSSVRKKEVDTNTKEITWQDY